MFLNTVLSMSWYGGSVSNNFIFTFEWCNCSLDEAERNPGIATASKIPNLKGTAVVFQLISFFTYKLVRGRVRFAHR